MGGVLGVVIELVCCGLGGGSWMVRDFKREGDSDVCLVVTMRWRHHFFHGNVGSCLICPASSESSLQITMYRSFSSVASQRPHANGPILNKTIHTNCTANDRGSAFPGSRRRPNTWHGEGCRGCVTESSLRARDRRCAHGWLRGGVSGSEWAERRNCSSEIGVGARHLPT